MCGGSQEDELKVVTETFHTEINDDLSKYKRTLVDILPDPKAEPPEQPNSPVELPVEPPVDSQEHPVSPVGSS